MGYPQTSAAEQVKIQDVKDIISSYALLYNDTDVILQKIAKCESSLNPKAWNKSDPHGGSKGLFQFQNSTFYNYAKILEIENPDIWNVEQQAEIASYMVSIGEAHQWTCFRKSV